MLTKLKNFFFSRRGVIVLVIIAVIVFFATRRGGNATEIKSAVIERGEVIADLVLPGEIKARQSVILNFPASSKLTSIKVSVGDQVAKGEFLGQIDTTALNAVYQQALATRRNTQATVDKIHDDLKDKGNSETFAEKATRTAAEVANDQAWDAVVIAQKSLRDAVIFSPIDGVVSQVGVDTVGSSTTVGTLAFQIIDPTSIYFSVTADQTEAGRISQGQDVEITLDAFDQQAFNAKVESVALTPNPTQTDTVYDVKISSLIPSDLPVQTGIKGIIRVGMTGDARLIVARKQNVLYVDSSFVKSDSEGKYVLKGQNKEKVRVETGIEGEDRVEILSGINQGDAVFQK